MSSKPRLIFINLPVNSVTPSTSFYESLGFIRKREWCSDTSIALTLGDVIHLMIHEPSRYKDWVPVGKTIANANKTSQVILSLSAENKAEVDEWVEKVGKAGGKIDPYKVTDGEEWGMYCRSFEDLDGHCWEVVYSPVEGCPEAAAKAEEEKASG